VLKTRKPASSGGGELAGLDVTASGRKDRF